MRRQVSLFESHVALLRERKGALITAAVTGEFDVTTASGRGVKMTVPDLARRGCDRG